MIRGVFAVCLRRTSPRRCRSWRYLIVYYCFLASVLVQPSTSESLSSTLSPLAARNNNRGTATSSAAADAKAEEKGNTMSSPSLAVNDEANTGSNDDDPWSALGGGAVNEKRRRLVPSKQRGPPSQDVNTAAAPGGFAPWQSRSHLWHALEGLDRYPNYLSRWNSERDVDALEQALQTQLVQVRAQRESIRQRRDGINKLVQKLLLQEDGDRWCRLVDNPPLTWDDLRTRNILDPRSSQAIFGSRMFTNQTTTPSLTDVLSGRVPVELDVERLQVLLDEELVDVYSFRLLSDEFCQELREFVAALSALGKEEEGTSSLVHLQVGKRPVDLDTVGLSWVNDLLFHLIIRPISRHLFQSTETRDDLDWRQGYVAGYSAQPTDGRPRERLVTHTDDSEVTLNIGLGEEDFEGGLIEFRGLRGTNQEGQLLGGIKPQPGLALLHAGRQFHDVTQVESGNRYAFIIWARSWKGARSITCPCCWLNRRTDGSCIAGPRWN